MKRWLQVFTLLLITSLVASAQSDTYPLTSNQWVQSATQGLLKGRVFVVRQDGTAEGVANARVIIKSVDEGSFRGETETNAYGEFMVRGVRTGVYSLTTSASNASSHQALQVIDTDLELENQFPRVAEVSATPLTYQEFRRIIRRYQSPINNRRISMRTADLDRLAGDIINSETYRVTRINGGVNGRIYIAGGYGPRLIPAPLTNVLIIQDGVEVGRAITDGEGDFRIDDVPPGAYSLLAVGRDGIASIGFELIAANSDQLSLRTTDGKQFVKAESSIDEFRCQIVPLGADQPEGQYPTSGMYGGGPGGGPGGGGGSGAGGDLGGLAGLAGLAAAIAAASSGGGGGGLIGNPPVATAFEPETGLEIEPFGSIEVE